MAFYAGRTLHTDGSYSVNIDPAAPRHAHGTVVLASGRSIPWDSSTGRDVLVHVGWDLRGVIREDGEPDAPFTLPVPSLTPRGPGA